VVAKHLLTMPVLIIVTVVKVLLYLLTVLIVFYVYYRLTDCHEKLHGYNKLVLVLFHGLLRLFNARNVDGPRIGSSFPVLLSHKLSERSM
jgi:hypothetical protein